eukprot:TRINITY_DN12779_c0_g1_i1.p1 TRINITY_DN12779_c0_g1~~TRINITY_DN12779_c0_g1_i1.p1  ORF type:complete len:541 (+),score=167.05 TRINITY_DN12779_c0_g1_i1:146-1624(+)
MRVAGKDTSKQFANFHDVKAVLGRYGPKLRIGSIAGAAQAAKPEVAKPVAKKQVKEAPLSIPAGNKSVSPPFAEASWTKGFHSPYYNDSHRRFREAVRKFTEEELMPHTEEWDQQKTIPAKEISQKAAKAGILGAFVGTPWPTEYAGSYIAGGVKPEEFDAFHELILQEELCRTGSYVSANGWAAGLSIGLPPVLFFGSKELKEKVAGPCLRGEKIISLAITEPEAGSDVAKITTEAKLSPCGKFYIVNGTKKWITNGIYSDFFTTVVRTGGDGRNGISVLVIERGPGVTTRQMECMGLTGSGTTFISFEDVKVPVGNLLGKENQGFRIVMHNFNHERMGVNMSAVRFARVCYEEAFKYACKRETFGKKLIEHPVIRTKLANMIKKIESTHALIEVVTYQLKLMSHKEAAIKLGGITALLKSQCTETYEYCTREASQIFGGLAYTKGGQGGTVERLFREARVFTVFAGSEEIMLDLGVKQALREYTDSLAKL